MTLTMSSQSLLPTFFSKSEKVDYALKRNGKPIILVEVKSAGKDLAHEHTAQLQRYFSTKLDVRFGLLTNGRDYMFYADLDRPNVMDDEPFLTVNMVDFEEPLAAYLSAFSKYSFDLESAKTLALKLKYKSLLRRTLEQEVRSPSDELIRLLIKRIRPELKSVTKRVIAEMTPIVKDEWREVFSGRTTAPIPISSTVKPLKTKIVTPRDVQQIPVFANYRSQQLKATLLFNESDSRNSRIKINGETFSVGKGADKAIRSINPTMSNGPNGWKFWKYRDPGSEKLRFISDLRSEETIRRRKRSP